SERDPFERGLANVESGGREREPMQRALRVLVPTGTALAAEQREKRETVRIGISSGERAVDVRKSVDEPAVEVPAVRERPSFDDTAIVDTEQEKTLPRLRRFGLVHRPESAGGADRQRGALARHAPGADVRARAVVRCEKPVADLLVRHPREPGLVKP